MNKDILFYLLAFLGTIDFTNYVFLVPILPPFLLAQGVSLTLIGFILSFFQVSNIIAALYLAKNLVHFTKTKVIVIGQALLILSNIAMGFLDIMSSVGLIVAMAIILRLIQGVAVACIASCTYSYVPILYPKDLDRKYALMEIGTGIGLALGPVIAGFLNEFLGFEWAFLTMSIVYFLTGMVVFPFLMKNDRQMKEKALLEAQEDGDQSQEMEKKPIAIRRIIRNRNFWLTFFFFVASLMSYSIIQPDFSDHIINGYGETDEVVGLIFGLGDLTYALTGFLMMHFISKMNIKRKYLFIFGGFMSMISLLLLGPEEYTFIPNSLISVIIGIGILGFSQMFYVPLFIPEILDVLKEIDPETKGNDEMASGLFMAGLSVTQFIGQILGGFLCDLYGFSRGMAIYAMFMIASIVIYALWRKFPEKKVEVAIDMVMSQEQVSYDQVSYEQVVLDDHSVSKSEVL